MKMSRNDLTVVCSIALIAAMIAEIAYGGGPSFLDTIAAGDALKVTEDSLNSATTLEWAVKGTSIVASSFLIYLTAKRLRSEDYTRAYWSFAAAIIAGCAPFFSEVFFL